MTGLAPALGPLLLALVTVAPAAPPCRVELLPPNAPTVWVSAAAALEHTLRTAPPGDRDCRDVLIRADRRSVEVTTTDGRRGLRLLAAPVDVEPTVAALIVTVAPEARAPRADLVELPGVAARRWALLLFAAGGGRFTFPGIPSPVVEAMVGVLRGPWELGLFGSWAPTMLSVGTTQADLASTAELGISAGRRQPLGAGALLLGARAGVVRLSPGPTQSGNTDAGAAPALSAFVGGVIPLLPYLRVRTQLSLQWSPPGPSDATDASSSLWSVGVSLGAESGIP
jgi:hypothetical protein